MRKKGFTLPELLAMLVFVCIIGLIVYSNVTNILKKTRENEYEGFLKDIYLATEAYIQKYSTNFPSLQEDGGQAYIYISDLVYSKLLKSTTYNPKNKEQLKQEMDYTIVITKGETTYEYELVEEKIDNVYYRPSRPELKDELIPINIAENGVVTKADPSNSSFSWYNYTKKRWANAVILIENEESYEVGEVIPEEKIESYFVWIPRYRYKLWDLGQYDSLTEKDTRKVHAIGIVFEDKDMAKSDGTCNGKYNEITVGCYYTHPAFTLGEKELSGIWVGKFETGYKGATSIKGAENNIEDSSKIIIKPNVYSWRNINVSNAFYTSYHYQREMESHMMKNIEWGAVAYLSHSIYGKNSSIRINNNSNYLTGYAAVKEPTCGYTGTNEECNQYGTGANITLPYHTDIGVLASTTGNITGIYDMSGGAYEYVMGGIADIDNQLLSGGSSSQHSGFNGKAGTEIINGKAIPERKYYDLYANNNSTVYFKNRILGDATGEMGPFFYATYGSQNRHSGSWYNSESYVALITYPWYFRGGACNNGIGSNIFEFGSGNGSVNNMMSFRISLGF